VFLCAGAAALPPGAARAGTSAAPAAQRPLPFCDDPAPPPPLAVPLDRAFRGEIVSFDGERVTLRWDWSTAAHLDDFAPFVPVRATLSGGFSVKDGKLVAEGTGGIRLRLAMLSDLKVDIAGTLRNPHDLGIVLAEPGSSDSSIVCLVQDELFTRFDAPAGNSNMINRLGGEPSANGGMVEFRYIARKLQPKLAAGASVRLTVERKGTETSFTIAPAKGEAETIKGRDNGTPLPSVTPGLYTSGGAAEFGTLTISGKIDTRWCADHGILPYMAADLGHAGNRWKPAEKKLAEQVERFARAAASGDAKNAVPPETVAALVGDVNAPLVVRIRAAEALLDRGEGGSSDAAGAESRLAALLDAKDAAARSLAWQVLRGRLPWHFKYETDAAPELRREAATAIAAWLRDRKDREAEGKVYVEGAWLTPEEADRARSTWEKAWEFRTPRIRLRSDLPCAKVRWCLAALEAEYAELVRLVGREPPAASLPLSAFVFKDRASFAEFCNANGYGSRATWGRFADVDRNVSLSTLEASGGTGDLLGQFAKQFHRAATDKVWPAWFDEGRAAWFGSAEYCTSSFDGTTLKVGLRGTGGPIKFLAVDATQSRMPGIADLVAADPRKLTPEQRRTWYAESWALHAWLLGDAPATVRDRFARWQAEMEGVPTTPLDVEEKGRKAFHAHFGDELPAMDTAFRGWVERL
jgi:hypothetical protein